MVHILDKFRALLPPTYENKVAYNHDLTCRAKINFILRFITWSIEMKRLLFSSGSFDTANLLESSKNDQEEPDRWGDRTISRDRK